MVFNNIFPSQVILQKSRFFAGLPKLSCKRDVHCWFVPSYSAKVHLLVCPSGCSELRKWVRRSQLPYSAKIAISQKFYSIYLTSISYFFLLYYIKVIVLYTLKQGSPATLVLILWCMSSPYPLGPNPITEKDPAVCLTLSSSSMFVPGDFFLQHLRPRNCSDTHPFRQSSTGHVTPHGNHVYLKGRVS